MEEHDRMNTLPLNLFMHRDIEEDFYRSSGLCSLAEALQLRLSFVGLYRVEDSGCGLYHFEDSGCDPLNPFSAMFSPSSLLGSRCSQHTMEHNGGNASLNDIQSTLKDVKLHLHWIYELVSIGANL